MTISGLEKPADPMSKCGSRRSFCVLDHHQPEGGAVFEVVPIVLVDKRDSVFDRLASSGESLPPSKGRRM